MGGFPDPTRLRRAVGPVVLALLLVTAFGVGGGFGGSALGAATALSIISGDIQVRHGASGSFVTATDGEVLTAGDTIRTGDAARAVLTYFEGSTVSIEPNSEIAIATASSLADGIGGNSMAVMASFATSSWTNTKRQNSY